MTQPTSFLILLFLQPASIKQATALISPSIPSDAVDYHLRDTKIFKQPIVSGATFPIYLPKFIHKVRVQSLEQRLCQPNLKYDFRRFYIGLYNSFIFSRLRPLDLIKTWCFWLYLLCWTFVLALKTLCLNKTCFVLSASGKVEPSLPVFNIIFYKTCKKRAIWG